MQINVLVQSILDRVKKIAAIDFRFLYERQKGKVFAFVLILAVVVVFFSTSGMRRRMVSDTLYWEKQAALVKSLSLEVSSEQDVINLLKNQAESSHRLILLSQGRDMVQVAKEYAQRMNIRLLKVEADPQQELRNRWGSTVVINSRLVMTKTIQIQAEAGYMNLVRYFDTLYRVAPAFVSVEKLKIMADKVNPSKLKISMELRFYTLSL